MISAILVTDDAFRREALALPRVIERQALDAIEFRVGRRVFATLGWPETGWALVQLSLDEQSAFLTDTPALRREPTRRRDRGVTRVRLVALDPNLLPPLLEAAWRHATGIQA